LGAICLPSSNVPETARITRIIHTPLNDGQQPELTYQPSLSQDKRTIVGEYGIRKSLLVCPISTFISMPNCAILHMCSNAGMDCTCVRHNQSGVSSTSFSL